MTDIVERLRGYQLGDVDGGLKIARAMDEAADEIKRLRQQRDELLEALEALVSDDPFDRSLVGDFNRAMAMARAAIAKAEGRK